MSGRVYHGEAAALERLREGVAVGRIVAETGMSEKAVARVRREAGIAPVRRDWSADEDALLHQMVVVERQPLLRAAGALGRTVAAVQKRVWNFGWHVRPRPAVAGTGLAEPAWLRVMRAAGASVVRQDAGAVALPMGHPLACLDLVAMRVL